MKHKPIIILSLGLFLIGFGCTKKLTVNQTVTGNTAQQTTTNTLVNTTQQQNVSKDYLSNPTVTATLPPCTDQAYFTASPMALTDIDFLTPLGNINPAGHATPSDHLGVLLKRVPQPGNNVQTITSTIKSPSDGVIIGVRQTTYRTNGQITNQDNALTIAPCRELKLYFGHLNDPTKIISDAIAQYTGDACGQPQIEGDQSFAACDYQVNIPVKAGDALGSSGGPDNRAALDFGTFDTRTPPLKFINTTVSIGNEDKVLHTTCPLDYYSASLKTQLLAKVKRTQEPRCGEYMQDKRGTIQGNWYTPGSNGQADASSWDKVFAVLHDNQHPEFGVVVVGGRISQPGRLDFVPNHSGLVDREPSKVVANGQTYCYQPGHEKTMYSSISGRILIQLIDDLTLKVEHQDGGCTAAFAFTQPHIYVR